jgi:hypothetical protein
MGRARLPRIVLSVAVLGITTITLLLVALDHDRAQGAQRARRLPAASITVSTSAPTKAVPRSFLGLSTEYWALPLWSRHLPLLERVLSLVHAPGDGPLILRIGGDSADHALWEAPTRLIADWVFDVTPAWLRETARLARQARLRLILDLNLLTASPASDAAWAATAERALPPHSIIGFEIGNEPDIYNRWYWLGMLAGTRAAVRLLPSELSSTNYVRDFHAYARALAAVAPGVPLAGPALANPAVNGRWVSALLAAPHRGLKLVTGHKYPYSACARRHPASYATIARVLSERATAGMARSIVPEIRMANRAGLPFRLTELNSVTCGGRRGVSNTFATALWAPDALFELLHAGVNGVNVHVRARAINAAFALTKRGLVARPLLYGLILFTRTLGVQPRLVAVHLRAPRSLHLKAWAVRVAGGALHVLVIDKGTRSANVRLRVLGAGPATVQRLIAPRATSTSDVRLDGQWLTPSGAWTGAPDTQTVRRSANGYELTVRGLSAALVSVRLPRQSHSHRSRSSGRSGIARSTPGAAAPARRRHSPHRARHRG